jgi:hypothetical protein
VKPKKERKKKKPIDPVPEQPHDNQQSGWPLWTLIERLICYTSDKPPGVCAPRRHGTVSDFYPPYEPRGLALARSAVSEHDGSNSMLALHDLPFQVGST